MADDRRPPTRRLKHAGAAVVLVVAVLIAVIFLGQIAAQIKEKASVEAVPAPQGGVQKISPPTDSRTAT